MDNSEVIFIMLPIIYTKKRNCDGSIHNQGSIKKERVSFKGLERTTLDFFLFASL
jgi:hypothetical protein